MIASPSRLARAQAAVAALIALPGKALRAAAEAVGIESDAPNVAALQEVRRARVRQKHYDEAVRVQWRAGRGRKEPTRPMVRAGRRPRAEIKRRQARWGHWLAGDYLLPPGAGQGQRRRFR